MCQHFDNALLPNPPQSKRPSNLHAKHITYKLCDTPTAKSVHNATGKERSACASVCQHSTSSARAPNPPQSKRTSKTRVKHITYNLRDAPSHPERPVPKRKTAPKRKECVQKCVSMFRQRVNAQPATNIAHVQHTRARYITYHLRDAPAVKRPWCHRKRKECVQKCVSISTSRTRPLRHNQRARPTNAHLPSV
jgi:hypothetical protein